MGMVQLPGLSPDRVSADPIRFHCSNVVPVIEINGGVAQSSWQP